MPKREGRPYYRLKSVKKILKNDEGLNIYSIANIKNGKCLSRRDLLKAIGTLVGVLGIGQLVGGCGGGGGDDTTTRSIGKVLFSVCSKKFLVSHDGIVRSLTSSEYGRYIVSGGDDKLIKLWDISTYKCIKTFKGHTAGVNSVAYNLSGKYIASGSQDKTAKLWNAETGDLVRTLGDAPLGNIQSITISSDRRYIAAVRGSLILIWDLTNYELVNSVVDDSTINSIAFSPDSKYIASAGKNIKIWDIRIGKCIKTLDDGKSINVVAFSPNGNYIASGGDDKAVKIWEISTSNPFFTLTGHTDSISCLAFSPNGNLIASGSADRTVKIWEHGTGTLIRTLKNTFEVLSIAFNPEGKYIASVDYHLGPKLWDVTTGDPIPIQQYPFSTSVAFSPDGKYLGSTHDTSIAGFDKIVIWDMATKSIYKEFEADSSIAGNLFFINDNSIVLRTQGAAWGGNNTVQFYEISTASRIRTLCCGHTGNVKCVVFTPDGEYVISMGDDLNVKLWEVEDNNLVWSWSTSLSIISENIAISPNGLHLAIGLGPFMASPESPGSLYVFDVKNGTVLKKLDTLSTPRVLAFSPNSEYIAAGCLDRKLRIWQVSTGALIKIFDAYSSDINSIAYSYDGKYIALGGEDDVLRIYDVDTTNLIKTFEKSGGAIRSVIFIANGGKVAIGSSSFIKIGYIATGKYLGVYLDVEKEASSYGCEASSDPLLICKCNMVCNCDQVCNCEKVCTCDRVCGCDNLICICVPVWCPPECPFT